jgi:hypothetical protein
MSVDGDSLQNILDGLPKLLRERADQLDQREKKLTLIREQALAEEYPTLGKPSDVLRLNVGGTRIDVLRRTLTAVEGSMLAAKFSGRWDDSLEKDADGNFFIDLPLELFLPMVDYLRAKACMTPSAPAVQSPSFADDFIRMTEYYGITLGIFPFGVFNVSDRSKVVSQHPDYVIEAKQWSSFQLLPLNGNTRTVVKSFEVILGQYATAQIGWMSINATLEEEKGVGYADGTIALDCGRSGIATGQSTRNGAKYPAGFTAIAGSPSMRDRTVLRCENKGEKFYVDGGLVASTRADEHVSQITAMTIAYPVPRFSIKGSLRISVIELERA